MPVRAATAADLAEIVRIYNQAVTQTTATFDLEPVTEDGRRDWFAQFGEEDPLFVCEAGEGVTSLAGFAYYLPYRPKKAYARTKELSVYVDATRHGQGVGSNLMQALLDHATEHHVHVMLAVIAGGNPASLALHQKFGFEEVGCLKQVGHKFGEWVDTAFWQKVLVDCAFRPGLPYGARHR